MRPTEKTEKLVKQMSFKAGPEMDKDLWADAASAHDQSQKAQQACNQALLRRIIMKTPITKAAVVALVCTGIAAAAVVGVKIYKWRFVEKNPKYGYMLRSEDGRFMTNVPESWADSPEHAVKVKEELDLLKQQGKRKLVGVTEYKVNGQHDHWFLSYDYTLSDGRVIHSGELDPDDNTPRILVGERQKEASQRLHEILEPEFSTLTTDPQTGEKLQIITPAEGVVFTIYDQVVQGQVFSFHSRQFTLDDGTTVTFAFGRLKEDSPDKIKTVVSGSEEAGQSGADYQEVAKLREQDKKVLVGVRELTADGELDLRVFTYQYELPDGRTMNIGEGGELNNVLNKEQRQEWVQLREAGSGEDLGTYEEEVEGRLFVFKRQRFVLGDGTEIIWSVGTLKDGK